MQGYNFTERVRKVLALAREESRRLHHEYVGTEHLLLGLIAEGGGVAVTVLLNLNVDLDALTDSVDRIVKRGDRGRVIPPDLPYTSRAKKVLELAMDQARALNHSYVGTEHLLLGIIDESKGIAAQVLHDLGVTLDKATAETIRILGSSIPGARPEQPPRTKARPGGADPEPPTETLLALFRDAESVATEYFAREATLVHAAIAMLRRGEGYAIAILDRLGCDREKARRAIETLAQRAGGEASPEQAATLDESMAAFLREMYQPWKIALGTLDLLLFILEKRPDVAAVFAEQGITAERVIDEGNRFRG